MVEVSLVTGEEDLPRLREPWAALLGESAQPNPFLSWEWMTSWWQAYGKGKKLALLLVRRGSDLIGLAPLLWQSFTRYRVFRYRVVRFLGDGTEDSDYLDLLSRSGEEQAVAEAVLDFLRRRAEPWDLLCLNEVPGDSPHLVTLLRGLSGRRWYSETVEVPCCWVRLPDSWEAYLRTLRPRERTKLRSLSRNLAAAHQVTFSAASRADELPAILESLFQLHQRRWLLKERSGVFTIPEKRHFYQLMSRAFLERGWLLLYSLAVDGRWVAHQFCFVLNRRVYLLQEGFDPDWGPAGVGNVLRAQVMEDCIRRGFVAYDFLAGVTPHKLAWGATAKRSVRLAIGSRTLKNHFYFLIPRAVAALKEAAAQHLPSPWVQGLRRLRRRMSFSSSSSRSHIAAGL